MSNVIYHKVLISTDIPHYAYAFVKASTPEEARERAENFIHRGDELKEYLYYVDNKRILRSIEDPDHIHWRRTNTVADYDGAEVEVLHSQNL